MMAQGRYLRVIAVRNSYSITADFTVTGDCQHEGYFESSKHGVYTHSSHKGRINQNEIMFSDAIELCYFYGHISSINIYDCWKTTLTLSYEIFCHNHHFFSRHIHILFQSKFTRRCATVLPPSISSIFSFPFRHPGAAYFFFLVFPSLLSFLQ